MSVDWADLSTPAIALSRFPHWPSGKRVVSITADACWRLCQAIDYTPIDGNDAHTSIVGQKTKSVRKKLVQAAKAVHTVSANQSKSKDTPDDDLRHEEAQPK